MGLEEGAQQRGVYAAGVGVFCAGGKRDDRNGHGGLSLGWVCVVGHALGGFTHTEDASSLAAREEKVLIDILDAVDAQSVDTVVSHQRFDLAVHLARAMAGSFVLMSGIVMLYLLSQQSSNSVWFAMLEMGQYGWK